MIWGAKPLAGWVAIGWFWFLAAVTETRCQNTGGVGTFLSALSYFNTNGTSTRAVSCAADNRNSSMPWTETMVVVCFFFGDFGSCLMILACYSSRHLLQCPCSARWESALTMLLGPTVGVPGHTSSFGFPRRPIEDWRIPSFFFCGEEHIAACGVGDNKLFVLFPLLWTLNLKPRNSSISLSFFRSKGAECPAPFPLETKHKSFSVYSWGKTKPKVC